MTTAVVRDTTARMNRDAKTGGNRVETRPEMVRPAGIEPATPAFGVLPARHDPLQINALRNSQTAKPRLIRLIQGHPSLRKLYFHCTEFIRLPSTIVQDHAQRLTHPVSDRRMAQHIEPSIGETAFNCPHCGAFTTQTWFNAYVRRVTTEDRIPYIPDTADLESIQVAPELSDEQRLNFASHCERVLSGQAFLEPLGSSAYCDLQVENVHISKCFNCSEVAIWLHRGILHPSNGPSILPNSDLNDDIKRDFNEARSILHSSPRGAAALLRLAVQKLCVQLGETGRNIDADIASLVKKGLNPKVQQALDIVRVIGNECVHPGELDMRDDADTATQLLLLVNLVAEQMITLPREINALYGKLPQGKRDAITARDARVPLKP
ncbi:DUF4145 domain-containing protein [Paraburkholderia nemoris]|uniref:DUF4145 domain-containing protein n=1 Tax=Paraburkholderia nemoris TaxID=2793076 RepID=UPI0038BD340A